MPNKYLEKASASIEQLSKEFSSRTTPQSRRDALRRHGYHVSTQDMQELNKEVGWANPNRLLKRIAGGGLAGAAAGGLIGRGLFGRGHQAVPLGVMLGGLAGSSAGSAIEHRQNMRHELPKILKGKIQSGEFWHPDSGKPYTR